MRRIVVLLVIVSAISFLGCNSRRESSTDERISKLVRSMTLKEKVGQMTQITIDLILKADSNNVILEPHSIDNDKLRKAIVDYKVGSILNVANHAYNLDQWHEIISTIQKLALDKDNLGIPVLYGIDAIHGVNYTVGGTLFPQQIGLAATWNKTLVNQVASISAYETRASFIPWNFSPVLDIGRNPLWPRLWETFGEDVYLTSRMGEEMVKGYEGNNIADKYKVASCLKHYVGYSLPLTGKDRTPAWIPENYLREYFLPSFAASIKAGAHSVMVCSGDVNGVPVHASYHILTEILRNELKFTGIAVSDWEDINKLYSNHKVAATPKEAVKMAVLAGIDMSMVPLNYDFADYLIELVNEKQVPVSRIDEAVERILKVKIELGLFENSYYSKEDYPKFGSEEFRLVSEEAANEAITLLKNENLILPLPKNKKVLVTGFAANSMNCLNGGWTYTWQGNKTDDYAGDKFTILEAIQNKIGKERVLYAEGVKFDLPSDNLNAMQLAKQADYIVLCLGELAYCEDVGNISDLSLPKAQIEFAKQLASTGKPIVLVLTEGRPRIIREIIDGVKGIIMAYLPGNEGGVAIANVLFGSVNPSGKLPITYPKYPNDLTIYDRKYTENKGMSTYDPQFAFGFGLSYTNFTYSNLKLDKVDLSKSENLVITVDVTNSGELKGKEVVQLYISDLVASIAPSVKRLRGFEKIELEPGQTKTVSFNIAAHDLAFVDTNIQWTTEAGDFEVTVDNQKAKFTIR